MPMKQTWKIGVNKLYRSIRNECHIKRDTTENNFTASAQATILYDRFEYHTFKSTAL